MADIIKRQLDRLPHFYNKDPESNNAKLIRLIADEIDEVYSANFLSEIWRVDLDEAQGKTLDLIGTNIRQYRGTDSDADYRLWLYAKLTAVLSRSALASHNQALELIAREAFVSLHESWASTFRLNQTEPNGIYLDGSQTLDGLIWHTEVDEPAAVIVELAHHPFFKMVRDRYKDVAGGEWLASYLNDVIHTRSRVHDIMALVKAGGVGMFWTMHVPDFGPVTPELVDHAKTIKLTPGTITKVGFGNEGHYTEQTGENEPGDPKEPTGSETETLGEHTRVIIPAENLQTVGEKTVIATIYIERNELNGELISSIGIYDDSDDLVAIKNIHPFIKDEKTRIIITWRVSGVFFNGAYNFDGTIYFEGAE